MLGRRCKTRPSRLVSAFGAALCVAVAGCGEDASPSPPATASARYSIGDVRSAFDSVLPDLRRVSTTDMSSPARHIVPAPSEPRPRYILSNAGAASAKAHGDLVILVFDDDAQALESFVALGGWWEALGDAIVSAGFNGRSGYMRDVRAIQADNVNVFYLAESSALPEEPTGENLPDASAISHAQDVGDASTAMRTTAG